MISNETTELHSFIQSIVVEFCWEILLRVIPNLQFVELSIPVILKQNFNSLLKYDCNRPFHGVTDKFCRQNCINLYNKGSNILNCVTLLSRRCIFEWLEPRIGP